MSTSREAGKLSQAFTYFYSAELDGKICLFLAGKSPPQIVTLVKSPSLNRCFCHRHPGSFNRLNQRLSM
jgi:hypothetical protein